MKLIEAFKKDTRYEAEQSDAFMSAINYSPRTLKRMLEGGPRIYRGTEGGIGNYMAMDSGKMRGRQSRYAGTNAYTLLMDNLPEWQSYPKRSQSYICATSKIKASAYGTNIYILIPHDNVPIGWCPRHDIWLSFNEIVSAFGELHIISDFVINLDSAVGFLLDLPEDKMVMPQTSWSAFKKKMDLASEILKGMTTEQLSLLWDHQGDMMYRRRYNEKVDLIMNTAITDFGGDLLKLVGYYMDPQDNGFLCETYPDVEMEFDNKEGNECWFSGKCIAIHLNEIETFMKDVKDAFK